MAVKRAAKPRLSLIAKLLRDALPERTMNDVLEIITSRGQLLKQHQEAIERIEQMLQTQFTRIAQIQAELDDLKAIVKGRKH